MDKADITKYLKALNLELAQRKITGEICLYRGAVMCFIEELFPS